MTQHHPRRRAPALLLALALASSAPQASAQGAANAPPGKPLALTHATTAAPAPAFTPPPDAQPDPTASTNGAPKNGAPANGASTKGAPTNAAPANAAPANAALTNGAPANAAPTNGAPANAAPANGAPADAVLTSLPRSLELRNRGKRAWGEGRYADAINDFEESVTLSPDPRLYYNLGLSYERVGRYPEALRWLTRFRSEASRDEVARAPSLETRVALLQNRVAVLKINTNVPGARVLVRDAVVGVQPAGKPLAVSLNAGRALVEIVGDGYRPYYKEHTLPGGGALELSVSLNREAAPVTVVEKKTTVYVHSPAFWSQWWFWAGASVLLAGGAATVYALSTEKGTINQGKGPIVPTALPSSAIMRF